MTGLVYCPGVCRVCGCTDEKPCEGGCTWVEADLCSQCADLEDLEHYGDDDLLDDTLDEDLEDLGDLDFDP